MNTVRRMYKMNTSGWEEPVIEGTRQSIYETRFIKVHILVIRFETGLLLIEIG